MKIKIYKTTSGHRQLQRLIEDPEAICVDSIRGKIELTRIPYKKHVLVKDGEDIYLPSYLARAKRKT